MISNTCKFDGEVGFNSLIRVERRGCWESLIALRPISLPPIALSLAVLIPRVAFATHQLAVPSVEMKSQAIFFFPKRNN